jgi:Arm DNA-binding domain
MPITDSEIVALKPKAKPYKVSIGKGAYILVNPNGKKYWRLKYMLDGKENLCSIGPFPKVSIDAAKAASESARSLIREGINPSVARREARAKSVLAQPIFRLGLSINGALTIETDTQCLIISPQQTQALAAFLAGNSLGKESL